MMSSPRSTITSSRAELIGLGARSGLLSGVLGGAADAILMRSDLLEPRLLWAAVLIWLIFSALVGVGGGLLAACLVAPETSGTAPRAQSWRSFRRLAALVTVGPPAWVIWILCLVKVNVTWLGSAFSPSSLIVDLLITLLIAGATWAATGATARSTSPGTLPGRARWRLAPSWLLGTWTGSAVLAAGVLLVVRLQWPVSPAAGDAAEREAAPDAPNVTLILIDTLRADHLSAHGYSRATSPGLDAAARRGTRFTGCISQSSYTKPSVASLLTSSYLTHHGAGHLRSVLDKQQTTLVEAFKRGGYRAAVLAANPLICPEAGFAQGADVFYGLESPMILRTDLGYALDKLADERLGLPLMPAVRRAVIGLESAVLGTRSTQAHSLDANQIIDAFNEWREAPAAEPFFAYLHLMEPHAPYRPSRQAVRRLGLSKERLLDSFPMAAGVFLPFSASPPIDLPDQEALVRAYDAEISTVDMALEHLIDELKNDQQGRPGIVVITSDHGEELNDHGSWGHGHSLHQELISVPLIMLGDGIPPGRSIGTTVELIDIGPTLLELAGLEPLEGVPGRSLVSIMQPGETEGDESLAAASVDEAVSELHYGNAYWARSLIRGRFKLIQARLGTQEHVLLVDLEADPEERENLAERRPDLAAALITRLDELLGPAGQSQEGDSLSLDSIAQERLRQLGYLE